MDIRTNLLIVVLALTGQPIFGVNAHARRPIKDEQDDATITRTTTTIATTIPAWVECHEGDDFIRDIRDCSVYYMCDNGVPVRFQCPSGTVFDTFNNICNWPRNVDCSLNPTPPPTTRTPRTTRAPRTTTTRAPIVTTSTTTAAPTTIPRYIRCQEDGQYIRDPLNCSVFYLCSNGVPHRNECPDGLLFDPEHLVCDYPQNVDCPSQFPQV